MHLIPGALGRFFILLLFINVSAPRNKCAEWVNAKTSKYRPHRRCLFLVITITKLRYAALTLMNIEKGFYLVTKKSLARN